MTNNSITMEAARGHQAEMVREIQQLTEMESPSNDPGSVNRLGEFIAQKFEHLGANVKSHHGGKFGNHIQASFRGVAGKKPILLLGHVDTVWELGTLSRMPFRIADSRLWGPGVLDMKAGIVMASFAVKMLKDSLGALPSPIVLLLNADEEVGSESSRPVTEALARDAEAVLVLEPAQGLEGSLKTARKGVGNYRLKVTGKAAHAGVDFPSGANAVLELARQIEKVSGFTDLERGLTVNVGVVHGGTRSNVIPAEAEAEVDIRVRTMDDAAKLHERFQALRPVDPRCRLEITGGVNRPPMERSDGVASLFKKAQSCARDLGFEVTEKSTGGGSDGNFTAALGIPTLDGLGAVGEGAHALNESVLLDCLAPRTALLARLIAAI